MSPLKLLDKLLFLESLFGVYRNYHGQKKIKQYFILLHIIFKTLMYTITFSCVVYFLLHGENGYDHMDIIFCGYSASAYLTAVPSIISGICYSSAFMSCYKSITRLFEFFKDDKKLMHSLQKTYWIFIAMSLWFISFGMLRFVDFFIKLAPTSLLLSIFASIVQFSLRMIIAYQYVVLFVITMIVVNLSKCLLSLISAVQKCVECCDVSSDEQCDIIPGEQIQVWVELYQDLAKCCEKITLCFGNQYFFLLILMLSYFVLLTYQFCLTNPFRSGNEYTKIIFVLCVYISLMVPPLVAGQMMKNQEIKIHRVLVRIYNIIVVFDSCEAEAKLIKDFVRLIKKNPLEIKLVSKFRAEMCMLPVILTLSVNYLIVILQFNHVI